jgi:hypothetical protein
MQIFWFSADSRLSLITKCNALHWHINCRSPWKPKTAGSDGGEDRPWGGSRRRSHLGSRYSVYKTHSGREEMRIHTNPARKLRRKIYTCEIPRMATGDEEKTGIKSNPTERLHTSNSRSGKLWLHIIHPKHLSISRLQNVTRRLNSPSVFTQMLSLHFQLSQSSRENKHSANGESFTQLCLCVRERI